MPSFRCVCSPLSRRLLNHLWLPVLPVFVACVFRSRKVLENRNMGLEDQLGANEVQLRSVKEAAEERDRMYDEVT